MILANQFGLGYGGLMATQNLTGNMIIPQDAYRYFPTEKEEMMTEVKVPYRLIFDGGVKLTEIEQKQVKSLKEHLDENEIDYHSDPIWTDGYLFRFLQANKFENAKAAPCIVEHTKWRKEGLPVEINEKMKKILESGVMYMHGRDNRFRPILVLKAQELNNLKLPSKEITELLTYFSEYLLSDVLLPGQVENWIMITDLTGIGVTNLPYNMLKEVFGFMQNNYRARLYRGYAVNAPWSFSAIWKTVKMFIEETTAMKINVSTSKSDEKMWVHINKSQVEKSYGGNADSPTQFWPPVIRSNQFFVEGDEPDKILISKDEYRDKLAKGGLDGYKTTVL